MPPHQIQHVTVAENSETWGHFIDALILGLRLCFSFILARSPSHRWRGLELADPVALGVLTLRRRPSVVGFHPRRPFSRQHSLEDLLGCRTLSWSL